ncbi:MAG: hypothetical protein WDZ60_10055 [Wenzhouxiangellaceae bacterium]
MKAQASPSVVRRESAIRDTVRALLLALAVHVAALGLLWLGSLSWQPHRPEITPSFTLVDAAPFVEAGRREEIAEAQAAAAERRLEQARREEAERQQALQREREQERAEEERQAALERQRRQQLEREAEQARRAEQQRQQEQQQRQLDDERREAEQARLRELEELRRQREQAQREREEQERRLAELAEQRVQEEARQRAEAEAERLRLAREQAAAEERRGDLLDEYIATIAEEITRNWIIPSITDPGVRCDVLVIQSTGGYIVDQAIVSPCNADEATRRSILAAVERTAELPYRGYEDVFAREIVFEFSYDGN